jgi:uncharacterized membrane protein YtjA (UPF0391 family)
MATPIVSAFAECCRRELDSARFLFEARTSALHHQEPVPCREVSTRGLVEEWQPRRRSELTMTILKWALIFLVISIVAGVLGFSGISAASADIARFLFYVFVVIFLVLLILGLTIFRA